MCAAQLGLEDFIAILLEFNAQTGTTRHDGMTAQMLSKTDSISVNIGSADLESYSSAFHF
jgi:hypothetical protein